MIDMALQRKNMVESQVRPSDVTDRRILNAMLAVPRETFVPSGLKPLAYMDEALTLVRAGAGVAARGMMAPRPFARLLQLAEIEAGDVVLDIGCASGYSAAVISRLAQTVVALESDSALADLATKSLADLGADNTAVVTGDLEVGYASEGPYDAIVIEGAIEQLPPVLLDQLKDGGRLVAVAAGLPSHAVVWRRTGRLSDRRVAFEAAAPVLPGFERKFQFVF